MRSKDWLVVLVIAVGCLWLGFIHGRAWERHKHTELRINLPKIEMDRTPE